MTIIGISNVPYKMNLKHLVKCLAPIINGHFEALNFKSYKNCKTAYVRLAPNLNAKAVISRIKKIGAQPVKAFIPDVIPDLPLSHHPKTIPTKMRRKLKISLNYTQKEVITKSLESIIREMQTKYPGLYPLSADTKHQLLENIGKIVYKRIKNIADNPSIGYDNCFKMTKSYRKRHPHAGDFSLILNTLHSIQDSAGKPRTQLQEAQLAAVALAEYSCIPYEKLLELCQSHISRISKQLLEHINNLEVRENTSTDAEAAQMKVRKHLKDLSQYIPDMVKKVITNHMIPSEEAFHVVKVYGEPYLPNKEIMQPFTCKYKVVSTIRAENMYNLISLKVPRANALPLLQADGTILNGNAKLVIRPGRMPFYKVYKYTEPESEGLVEESRVESTDTHEGELGVDQGQGNYEEENMEWAESW